MPRTDPERNAVSRVEDLRSTVRGAVLVPSDPGYDAARKVHNGMVDRQPAMIVRCSGVADVMRALDFGVSHGLPITVRSGGHGLPGYAVCDGGVMIDLSGFSAVTVDPVNKTARAQGGATWGQFDHETQAFGLATTGGLVRTTGLAGLTLGGGHGFLMRRFGLACDNLVAVEVLTAKGELVRADDVINPELFWALRGGGGNFGIVTAFEYRLHQVGPVLGGLLVSPFEAAVRSLTFYDEFSAAAPDELGVLAILATLPDGAKAFVNLVCYSGLIEAGERVVEPLRRAVTPLADRIQTMPYTTAQSIVETFNPPGLRNYWKTVYLSELTADAGVVLTDMYSRAPAPHSHIVLYTLGGAVSRVPAEQSAVAYRDARHVLIIVGMWENQSDDEINIEWVRRCCEAMQPFASGGFYPNYEESAPEDRLIEAFGPHKYQRLSRVKSRYDPTNIFCLNQNILPVASA